MNTRNLLTTVAALALCLGLAEARGSGSRNRKPPVDEFKKHDKDHDGLLTVQEFGGDASQFAKLDKNGDGKLDRYEFSQAHKKHR